MAKYRARGHYRRTDRDSWVTTVWRDTYKDAQEDLRCFTREKDYSKVWIVKKKR